jgi:hypothetical protein
MLRHDERQVGEPGQLEDGEAWQRFEEPVVIVAVPQRDHRCARAFDRGGRRKPPLRTELGSLEMRVVPQRVVDEVAVGGDDGSSVGGEAGAGQDEDHHRPSGEPGLTALIELRPAIRVHGAGTRKRA